MKRYQHKSLADNHNAAAVDVNPMPDASRRWDLFIFASYQWEGPASPKQPRSDSNYDS